MRIGVAQLAAGVAAALVLAVPAAARPARVCGPADGHTLAQSRAVRVYSVPQTTPGPGRGNAVVLACARGLDRADQQIRLGFTSTCIASTLVQRVAVAGGVVAYAVERCGVDTGSTQVVVLQVARSRTVAAVSAGDSPGPESYTSVESLVVKADGAAAWIASARSLGRQAALIEVWKLDRGVNRVLDSSAAIAVHSLRLHGHTLRWRDRGQRSATLA